MLGLFGTTGFVLVVVLVPLVPVVIEGAGLDIGGGETEGLPCAVIVSILSRLQDAHEDRLLQTLRLYP